RRDAVSCRSGHRNRELAAGEETRWLPRGRGQVWFGQNRDQPLLRQRIDPLLYEAARRAEPEENGVCRRDLAASDGVVRDERRPTHVLQPIDAKRLQHG